MVFIQLIFNVETVVAWILYHILIIQVGLAVDDIKSVQAQANLKRQAMLVRMFILCRNESEIKETSVFFCKNKFQIYRSCREWICHSFNMSFYSVFKDDFEKSKIDCFNFTSCLNDVSWFSKCSVYSEFGHRFWTHQSLMTLFWRFLIQVDLALNVEKAFPRFIRRRMIPEIEMRHPNWMRERFFTTLDGEAIRDRLHLEQVTLLCIYDLQYSIYDLIYMIIQNIAYIKYFYFSSWPSCIDRLKLFPMKNCFLSVYIILCL